MTTLTSVDLPEPLSPSRPTISRGLTLKLTPDSERTSPNDLETFLSSMTGGSPALLAAAAAMPSPRIFEMVEASRGAAPRPCLADFLGGQRRNSIDVLFVDEGACGVDVETREAELLGQADIEDRQVTLQIVLLVDHEILIAFLD